MPRSPRRFVPHAVLAAVALAALGVSAAAAAAVPFPGEDHYNSQGFIVRHAWVKFAFLATRPFRDGLSRDEQDARVARFFELNALIRERERTAGDPATPPEGAAAARRDLAALRRERRGIENSVEAIIAGRVTAVAKRAGLTRHAGGDLVWPPVSFEFEDAPAVLVESPRDEIRRQDESLLQGNLPVERVQRLEADAERDGRTSALVVQVGGIAMYPSIIPPQDDYRATLRDVAHEWLHHYLFFTPLGRHYFGGSKLRTLNETLANMAGRELGDMVFEAYPLPARDEPERAARTSSIDFVAEMRGLRREVEALLADGKIEEAERLMEEKRRFLAANGYYIRRLNQAYFAFHGSYADTAGSIDPIGPKFEALRARTGGLADFVATAREFTSEADLDAALATP